MTLSRPMVGHLAMLGFASLVSFSFTFGAMVARDIDPGVLTSLRFVVATLVLILVARLGGLPVQNVLHRSWRWLIIGGLFAAYFIAMFEALRLTSALATSAVFTLTPLIAAGLGWLLIGARSSLPMLGALVLGGIGALWVIFKGDLALFLALDIGPGERLFFMGVVAHAAIPALTRRLAPGAAPLEAALGTSLGALVISSLYALPQTVETEFTALRPLVWAVVLYLGVITTAVTFFLLQTGIARLSPGKVMAYTYLVPTLVLGQGLIFDGRQEAGVIYIGVALTLIALLILVWQDAQADSQ